MQEKTQRKFIFNPHYDLFKLVFSPFAILSLFAAFAFIVDYNRPGEDFHNHVALLLSGVLFILFIFCTYLTLFLDEHMFLKSLTTEQKNLGISEVKYKNIEFSTSPGIAPSQGLNEVLSEQDVKLVFADLDDATITIPYKEYLDLDKEVSVFYDVTKNLFGKTEYHITKVERLD